MYHYSQFAKAAYETNADARQTMIPPGYFVDADLSNRNRLVAYNPETQSVILAERGTKPSGKTAPADFANNALYATGFTALSTRVRNSLKVAKKIQEQYPGWDFSVTGHSAGGTIAQYLHKQLDLTAVTFSAHTPTREILTQALVNTAMGPDPGLTQYTVPWDPIGAGTFLTGSAVAVKQTSSSPHDLRNFTAPAPQTYA